MHGQESQNRRTLAVEHAQDGAHVRVQLQAVVPEGARLAAALVQLPQRACACMDTCACSLFFLRSIPVTYAGLWHAQAR
jgi:hypothetical protein